MTAYNSDSIVVQNFLPPATPLETQIEFMRFCEKCDCEQIFTAVLECQSGHVGCCQGCGDERLIPFSRSISEVA